MSTSMSCRTSDGILRRSPEVSVSLRTSRSRARIRIGREDALGVAAQALPPTARMGSVRIREWVYDHRPAGYLGSAHGYPFVFPSRGPTAYFFFFAPLGTSSSPRNAILGYAIGLLCGYGAFWITGTPSAQEAFHLVY